MERLGEYVTEIATLFPRQGEWTEEAYFALPETNRRMELSDGVIIMSPSPTVPHQEAVAELYTAVRESAQEHGLGRVFIAPLDVRLWKGKVRQPDVLLIRPEHADRITDKRIMGAPDWVAEIISPGSVETDLDEKFHEYAQAGVPEYWQLDLGPKAIRVYVLDGESYRLAATYTLGEMARSETLAGFEVAVDRVIP